jgi:acetyl esterase/lipase
MKIKFSYLLLIFSFICSSKLQAQADTIITKDIVYAEAGNKKLLLDLYIPADKKDPYLIIWVHGGAWRAGSKEKPPLSLLPYGYALASVDYRLSGEAIFPAPIYDIKAAIRFLRGNAIKYGYRSDKIIIWGSSSGGHYAALIGTTNGDPYYEGDLGSYTDQSSSVQAVLDFYGPTNFLTILDQSTPHGISVRVPALTLLLGKPVEQIPDLARKASPLFQVDPTDPPILIVHGDQDPQVPVNQSLELWNAYKKNSLKVQLEIISGAAHGGSAYDKKEMMETVDKFLKTALQNK